MQTDPLPAPPAGVLRPGERIGERGPAGRFGLVSGLLADALDSLRAQAGPGGAARSGDVRGGDARDGDVRDGDVRDGDVRDGAGVGAGAGHAAVRVLDCGGGTGAFAVPLARAGADVTVVDVSADALATLRRRADEAGVSAHVHALPGDVESLDDLVPAGGADLVLAHGILDAVDDPARTVAAMARAVRPGGLVSILVANPTAAVLARALGGEPAAALQELRDLDTPGHVGPGVVAEACGACGLAIEARHGIGVFSDLVPGSALDAPGARAAVAALDAEAAGRSPFADIAGRVHLLARRASG